MTQMTIHTDKVRPVWAMVSIEPDPDENEKERRRRPRHHEQDEAGIEEAEDLLELADAPASEEQTGSRRHPSRRRKLRAMVAAASAVCDMSGLTSPRRHWRVEQLVAVANASSMPLLRQAQSELRRPHVIFQDR